VFTGKANSGIGLLNKKNLPKDGYAFCGHIRLERQQGTKMTIFKLASYTNNEIELLIQDKYITYYVHSIHQYNR